MSEGPSEELGFDEFLVHLRKSSRNTIHQGLQFEQAMAALLPQHPDYDFEAAWLWREWPQREAVTGQNAQDNGIDVVARLRDRNEYWAVQCKFYDSESTVSASDLGTFFTASGKQGFSGRLIITTTDKWTSTADKMLNNQQVETHRLRLNDLRDLEIEWNWKRPDKTRIKQQERKSLYPFQKEAFEATQKHFEEHDRGRLIMACGTGKTFTSLKIAEACVPQNGYVLFVVPSLSLMRQSIQEWSRERSRDRRYLGICSDVSVGVNVEDSTNIADIPVPVSTDPGKIASFLNQPASKSKVDERMTVVFCTYQSLDRLSLAQERGAPEFDLIICDEAHRTTGVDRENRAGVEQSNSNFVKIHEQSFIKGRKRLYMTATPRIYTEAAKAKASDHNLGVFSMDDEAQYGAEIYKLGFSKAVDAGMLSDYRVVILTVSEDSVAEMISKLDKDIVTKLDLKTDDTAKIIGCYKALRDQGADNGKMLKRAVSFSSSIRNSNMVVDKFTRIVEALDAVENDGFTCQLKHVDGKQTALDRSKKLDWLRENAGTIKDGEVCRILSNARCLTEGVDVPSLDAVLFMNPRKSQVDVVQAVGRVMRKAKDKDYGYVILPVVIPTGGDIEATLDKNDAFGVVWEVLRALRAHDDRLTNHISKIELNQQKPDNISIVGVGFGQEGDKQVESITGRGIQLSLGLPENLVGLIQAKIVDKVGDKYYLEQWARDTAKLHDLLVRRIDDLKDSHSEVADIYQTFLGSLRKTIHDGLDESDASSMLAQQLITSPIFDALFEGYQFSKNNAVSRSLNEVLERLNEYGLKAELKSLDDFYKSVTNRVLGLDNDGARQKVITELYEKFFTTAFPKTSESLGIAYTPIELVDFTLKSADEVMRMEFGCGLSDEGVQVIDPFTGTGSFVVRLLNSLELIKDSDLHRKFTGELWANEILLLAYYIASVNIEVAYHQRGQRQYQSFTGISLTDTFEPLKKDDLDSRGQSLKENNARITAQHKAPIRIVVGNPPWSAGQKSQNDNNANRDYPTLDKSIRSTYAKRSNATNLNALYDSYIRAIRWASDRIGDEGVVAFVTNAGWLEGTSTDGMRLCLEEEFDAIWLFNLRGNARLSGEARRMEGDNTFGQASRAPVVISLFVKNPVNPRTKAEIRYHDIGDYLKREAKLNIVRNAGDISGLEWKTITPNADGDWLNLRDPIFQSFMELSNDNVRRGKAAIPKTIFRSYSNGLKSNRDAWVYNFSHEKISNNMARMIDVYNEEVSKLTEAKVQKPDIESDTVLDMNPTRINWDSTLKIAAEKGRKGMFNEQRIIRSLYRPFTMEYLYFDHQFNNSVHRQPTYLPTPDLENHLICVTGKGSSSGFACLMSDAVPDLGAVETTQTFPRWVYRKNDASGEIVREDNITKHALKHFQTLYDDNSISKDDIFHYVYGVLHAPDYRKRFATDLRLGLPRIPAADDFWAFANAGAILARLHLDWHLAGDPAACTELACLYNGNSVFPDMIPEDAFKVRKMSWLERPEGKLIKYSQHLSIGPIPEKAIEYTIGSRTPLDWVIARYQIKTDKDSGIVNDPNDWIAEQGRPDALIELIKRVTFLSIETAKIIDSLPNAVAEE